MALTFPSGVETRARTEPKRLSWKDLSDLAMLKAVFTQRFFQPIGFEIKTGKTCQVLKTLQDLTNSS